MHAPATWRDVFGYLDGDTLGLNLDPSHLVWQMIDYERVVREFGERHLPRPRQGHGDRPRRPLRPGRHVGRAWAGRCRGCPGSARSAGIASSSALYQAGYDYAVVVEHEDRQLRGQRREDQGRLPDRPQRRRARTSCESVRRPAPNWIRRRHGGGDRRHQASACGTRRRCGRCVRRGRTRRWSPSRRRGGVAPRRRSTAPWCPSSTSPTSPAAPSRREPWRRSAAGAAPSCAARSSARPPRQWDAELAGYLDRNEFSGGHRRPADEIFAGLRLGPAGDLRPIYWSLPQIAARQHDRMVRSAGS